MKLLNYKTLLITLIATGLFSCSSTKKAVNINRVSKHFYPMPSHTKNLDKDWVIILPGYSGINVFKDTTHYFKAAQELNAVGFDVLVVDYKKASRKAGYRFPGNLQMEENGLLKTPLNGENPMDLLIPIQMVI